ncbi:MAG: glycerol-3-phosphate acyltransferase [Endomicrobiaceae bacterium]|jgi:glycerol-3-phosphate acyltransferase PlsY|nr:glycerol-3-phosphate acyltransferase [Candidatus Cloacimonadota bacterium]
MYNIIIYVLISIASYGIGCFSTARVLAKSFKYLNIYKVGTGFADTENIYSNISKPLGIVAAILDSGKMFLYLSIIKFFFIYAGYEELSLQIPLFIFGFFMIGGHCLPVTHKFRGGRGIFTYIGLMMFFAFQPMIYVLLIAIVIIMLFKQIRFAQFFIVLFPPILSVFWIESRQLLTLMFITAFLMGVLNLIVARRLGEI